MTSAMDVDVNKLNAKVADKLKEMGVEQPAFVGLVKSGPMADRPPQHENFFFVRCASMMRQAYNRNVIGVQRLRLHYGGKKNRGVKPNRHVRTGGSTIRKAFQALEKAGLMEKIDKGLVRGRKLTPKGRKLLDGAAKEVKKG